MDNASSLIYRRHGKLQAFHICITILRCHHRFQLWSNLLLAIMKSNIKLFKCLILLMVVSHIIVQIKIYVSQIKDWWLTVHALVRNALLDNILLIIQNVLAIFAQILVLHCKSNYLIVVVHAINSVIVLKYLNLQIVHVNFAPILVLQVQFYGMIVNANVRQTIARLLKYNWLIVLVHVLHNAMLAKFNRMIALVNVKYNVILTNFKTHLIVHAKIVTIHARPQNF